MRPSRQPEELVAEGAGNALVVAFAYLNKRERTVAEVRARLQLANLREEDIDEALDELVGLGYLDDARYARLFTEDKQTLENWGRERIERALRERGVGPECIGVALAGADSRSEMQRAVDLLLRRFPAGSPTEHRDRERAFGVLIRKGYASEVASEAVLIWRDSLDIGHRCITMDDSERTVTMATEEPANRDELRHRNCSA